MEERLDIKKGLERYREQYQSNPIDLDSFLEWYSQEEDGCPFGQTRNERGECVPIHKIERDEIARMIDDSENW